MYICVKRKKTSVNKNTAKYSGKILFFSFLNNSINKNANVSNTVVKKKIVPHVLYVNPKNGSVDATACPPITVHKLNALAVA